MTVKRAIVHLALNSERSVYRVSTKRLSLEKEAAFFLCHVEFFPNIVLADFCSFPVSTIHPSAATMADRKIQGIVYRNINGQEKVSNI